MDQSGIHGSVLYQINKDTTQAVIQEFVTEPADWVSGLRTKIVTLKIKRGGIKIHSFTTKIAVTDLASTFKSKLLTCSIQYGHIFSVEK